MLIVVAIARQVHATATTRTKVLTACFMAFSLHAGSLGAETLVGRNYIFGVKADLAGKTRCIILRQNRRWGKKCALAYLDRGVTVLRFREGAIHHVLEHGNQRF